jgi:glycosyltransferase involved in cell wall biosynthesis
VSPLMIAEASIRIKISVVVCTYNRELLLSGCLQSLTEQSIGQSLYEVIIVDNNSTDGTQAVGLDYVGRYRNFRYGKEQRQGKSYACNTGIRLAKGKYVAFIDDDAKASSNWLERIVDAFESIVPTPVAVGGTIYPWFEHRPPSWFSDDMEIRTWGDERRFLKPPRGQLGFSGSNMAFQKDILAHYGGFPTDIGPVGNKFELGEEAALFFRIYRDYPYFWYDPDISVRHLVAHEKMRVQYQLERAYLTGIAVAKIRRERSMCEIARRLMSIMWHSILFPFRIPWGQEHWLTGFVKYAQPIGFSLGILRGSLSLSTDEENWAIERSA